MKLYSSLILILLLSLLPSQSAAADDVIEKTACTQAIYYESLDELKKDLLTTPNGSQSMNCLASK